jgi:hypothetical protein
MKDIYFKGLTRKLVLSWDILKLSTDVFVLPTEFKYLTFF